MKTILLLTDFGVVVLAVIIALLLMKWESKHATSYWERKNKKK
jgi:hypothetical protein